MFSAGCTGPENSSIFRSLLGRRQAQARRLAQIGDPCDFLRWLLTEMLREAGADDVAATLQRSPNPQSIGFTDDVDFADSDSRGLTE